MILDQFSVFFDDVEAAASMESQVIHVSPFTGRNEPFYISVVLRGDGAAELTIDLQEADAIDGEFSTVGTALMSKPDAMPMLKAIRLPTGVKKPFLRLKLTATGTLAGSCLFAGVSRDHFAPYEPGLYIDGQGVR